MCPIDRKFQPNGHKESPYIPDKPQIQSERLQIKQVYSPSLWVFDKNISPFGRISNVEIQNIFGTNNDTS